MMCSSVLLQFPACFMTVNGKGGEGREEGEARGTSWVGGEGRKEGETRE